MNESLRAIIIFLLRERVITKLAITSYQNKSYHIHPANLMAIKRKGTLLKTGKRKKIDVPISFFRHFRRSLNKKFNPNRA